MNKNWVAVAVLGAALSGCAHFEQPVPANYSGPTVTIQDSVRVHSTRKADIFYVEGVNGKRILDSRTETLSVNRGRGMYMTPVTLSRKLPAQPTTLTITGKSTFAAPILEITNPVYEVSGKVDFAPESGKSYVVRGELGKDYSAVWIEDVDSHAMVGQKIETRSSSAK